MGLVAQIVTALSLLTGAGVDANVHTAIEVGRWERALAVRSEELNRRYGLPRVVAPSVAPVAAVPEPPAPRPSPPLPPPEGEERPDLLAGVRKVTTATVRSVFCRTDAAWPASLQHATGYWLPATATITLRTWRCAGLVVAQVGKELFARSLFVLAHEATHAEGVEDECEADKGGVAKMPDLAVALGYGQTAGLHARDLLLSIYRAAPLPSPYCLGRF